MTIPCAVITGATGGIGRWIALGLAEAGFRLFIVGRDPARLALTRQWVAGRVPGCRLDLVAADLSLLSQTRAAADVILQQTDRLALLINNAGTLSGRRITTAEGHERTLAVNHLAPFVLTRALLPALRSTGTARIVGIGSSTSDRALIDPDDLELTRHWAMVRAYARSKLALLMTSLALADELAGEAGGSGVSVNVVHPGIVATGLVRNPGVVGLAWKLMAPFCLSECRGAAFPLHAALSAEFAGLSGVYLKRSVPARPNPRALDPLLRARVVAATEALVRVR